MVNKLPIRYSYQKLSDLLCLPTNYYLEEILKVHKLYILNLGISLYFYIELFFKRRSIQSINGHALLKLNQNVLINFLFFFCRVILLESRPSDSPSVESNLYVLAGHENNFWFLMTFVAMMEIPADSENFYSGEKRTASKLMTFLQNTLKIKLLNEPSSF